MIFHIIYDVKYHTIKMNIYLVVYKCKNEKNKNIIDI